MIVHIDKNLVRRAFERSAKNYDSVARLQQSMGRRLLEHLKNTTLTHKIVLDLGCGTGWAAQHLIELLPNAKILGMDFAFSMLQQARQQIPGFTGLCGDAETIPLKQGSVDLVFSNATLQWCDNAAVFAALHNVLASGGLLLFSTFGPDTLRELRLAWSKADSYSHVSTFYTLEDLHSSLIQAKFTNVIIEREYQYLLYPQVLDLLADLKTLGAHNATSTRPRGLTGKGRLAAMLNAYECLRTNDQFPVTYEVLYGLAWNY